MCPSRSAPKTVFMEAMTMVSARSNFPLGLGSGILFDVKGLKLTLLKANQRKVLRSVHMSAVPTAALPAWEELSETLKTPYDLPTRLPNVKNRTFGANQEPALIFYRDSASWCPYCQRVWIQLEEKEIPYQVEKINMRCYGDKPDWFLRMVPSGLLPVVKLKGRVLTESLDIMLIIEDQFPSAKPLLPPEGTAERDASGFLLKLERQLGGAWLDRLRNRWSRPGGFEGAMDKVNSALEQFGGPYFLGKEVQSLASFYSTVLATAIWIPCEVLKQRLQAGWLYTSVGEAITGTLQNDGWKGFFRGTEATLCREVPFYVAGTMIYEETKKIVQRLIKREREPWKTIAIGGLSGGLAAVCTTPFDVMKTRMMTATPGVPITMSTIAVSIVREQGFVAFFKGALPRFFWIAPLGAMNFAGYELAKRAMEKKE